MKTTPIELAQTASSNENKEGTPKLPPKSQQGKYVLYLKTILAFITVEPFLLCYVLPNTISNIAIQSLNLEKAYHLNYTEMNTEMNTEVKLKFDNPYKHNHTSKRVDAIQPTLEEMKRWQIPLQIGIPAILILFVGAWSDRTGNRKLLMLLPIIGELVSAIGLILTTYFFDEWPLWVTALIESLPTALSGGFSIAVMGAYSYLADVTTEESRTYRIGMAAVIVTLGKPVGLAVSGILIKEFGFYSIFGTTTVLYCLGALYAYFRIFDVKPIKIEGTWFKKLKLVFYPRNVWATICIVLKSSTRVTLVIAAHIFMNGPIFGEGENFFQFMVQQFKMTAEDISLFYTYSIILGMCGTAVAVSMFSRLYNMHDALLGIIATVSKVVSCCVYGFAPTIDWFYSGAAFNFFGDSGMTAILSLGTKVVQPEHVGKMLAVFGFLELMMPMVYKPMYTQLYLSTKDTLPGAFHVLGVVMTVPALFIFIALYVMFRKEQKDVVKNPEAKETYARDNYITPC